MKIEKKKSFVILLVFIITITFVFGGTFLFSTENNQRPPDSNRMEKGFAPTPYSANEIKLNCPQGRVIVFQVETSGKPLFFQTMKFGTESQDGTVVESTITDAAGNIVGQKQFIVSKWTELQAHASFPEDRTRIETQEFTTPLGTFDCWLYTISSETNAVKSEKRFWFAKILPGPPICYEEKTSDVVTYRLTMLKSTK